MATIQKVRKGIKKGLETVAARVYLNGNQTDLTDNSFVKIDFDSKDYDLGGNFNTVDSKFVVPVTGLYRVSAKLHFVTGTVIADKSYGIGIYVNGVLKSSAYEHIGGSTDEASIETTEELYLNVDDYIEVYAKSIAGASTVDVLSGRNFSSLTVRLITKEGIRQ